MTAEHRWRELLVQDALEGRPQFHNLTQGLKLELQEGITGLVDQLELDCDRRWNSVSFLSVNEILIQDQLYSDHMGLVKSLREKVKQAGVGGRRASNLVNGAFRDTVFMIQARVDSLDQLRSTRARFRSEAVVFQGEELHTRSEVFSPQQRRATLLEIGE